MENSSSDFDDILTDPITLKEIEDILTVLPNNKALGDDGITYEHITAVSSDSRPPNAKCLTAKVVLDI